MKTQVPNFILEHENDHSAPQTFKLLGVNLQARSEQSELLHGVFVLCCTQLSSSLNFSLSHFLLPFVFASRTLASLCRKQGSG